MGLLQCEQSASNPQKQEDSDTHSDGEHRGKGNDHDARSQREHEVTSGRHMERVKQLDPKEQLGEGDLHIEGRHDRR